MTHQITLVGGQIIPVYLGIKEFTPERIHFIFSNDSMGNLTILRKVLKAVKSSEYSCDAFDFYSVKAICEKIISKLPIEDEVYFNLTGGTKIMVLACLSVINERKLTGFYINQDNTFLKIPSYGKGHINSSLSIDEFFELSDHDLLCSFKLEDFTKEDFGSAMAIEKYANSDRKYFSIVNYMRKKYDNNNLKIPPKGKEMLPNGLEVNWEQNLLSVTLGNKQILSIESKHSIELFFNAGWWELIVAKEINKWVEMKEMLINCILPFKADKLSKKNEIDILINTGKRLIFVECKSGNVRQEDINKMKVIKQTYGGVISKSILISKFLLSPTIMEKCKELDIVVFYTHAFHNKQITPLGKVISVLDKLNKKASI